jgi:RHS repeat-associated protein
MTVADTNVTVVGLTRAARERLGMKDAAADEMQVAMGGVISDADGTRRLVIMFPTGLTASVITSGGVTQLVDTLTTRFTEYTAGSNGPSAMPGDLPPQVAYTYAVDLGAEEAQAKVAGKDVLFNTNVICYLDNFLGFPEGGGVPSAYYNRDSGAWVPDNDGLVVRLLGTNSSGLALVSGNTNGVEINYAEWGITDSERRKLAEVYRPATNSLWRILIRHFSSYDWNYGVGNNEAMDPYIDLSEAAEPEYDASEWLEGYGSLDIENRVFREAFPVAGTPFALCYSSDQTPDVLNIPLTSNSYPSALQRIDLKIGIAGTNYSYSFAPSANLSYNFTWNGRDVYGRELFGAQPASIDIGYVYQGYYLQPDPGITKSNWVSFGYSPGYMVTDIPSRRDYIRWQNKTCTIACRPANNIAGWSLNAHHVYDPVGKKIMYGNGTSRSAAQLDNNVPVITTLAGTNVGGFITGQPAKEQNFGIINDVAAAADGTFYFSTGNCIVRVDTNDLAWIYAGNWFSGDSGDAVPALSAYFNTVRGLVFGPDNSLYFADSENHKVRRVGTNGIVYIVAGTGSAGYSGDNGPATNATLNTPTDVAVASDGTVFIADFNNHRIRRVGPDGTILTCAGKGTADYSGDGGAATNATLNLPQGIAVGPDGSLYIADTANYRVRKVGADGVISTIAGTGNAGFSGDGGPAVSAKLDMPLHVALDADGGCYLADYMNNRIRYIRPDGIIATYAGEGSSAYAGDEGPARQGSLSGPKGLGIAHDGALLIADTLNKRVRQVAFYLEGVGLSDILVASDSGDLIYNFDSSGRHQATYNAYTGEALLTFGYSNGWLVAVTDGDNNATRLERSTNGAPTAIVSQDGQRTTLTVNDQCYITSIKNPNNETTQLGYGTNGLLTSVQGAKGAAYTYTASYDSNGKAWRCQDPAGGFTALGHSRSDRVSLYIVTNALSGTSTNRVENLATGAGDLRRTVTHKDGTTIDQVIYSGTIETNWLPDGTVVSTVKGPDPRFGMETPILQSMAVTLPSGLASTSLFAKTVVTTNLALISLTQSNRINGRAWVSQYAGSNRMTTVTSPAGRITRTQTDAKGRRVLREITGLTTVSNSYDSRGRLTVVTAGDRVAQYQYDPSDGFLSVIVDALGRTNTFDRDTVGRPTTVTRPDGQAVVMTYDAHGNMTSLTPPGRPAHTFVHSLVDLVTNYTAPGSDPISAEFNAERRPTRITLPGNMTIASGYDRAGRPGTNTFAEDSIRFAYDSSGRLASLAATGSVTIAMDYDGSLVTTQRCTGAVTSLIAWAYDSSFRVTSRRINATSVSYGYDNDDLLTSVGDCAYTRSAANGLLVGSAIGVITDFYQYNGFGEVTNYVACSNATAIYTCSYNYDKAGRITSRSEAIAGDTIASAYGYDVLGQITSVISVATGDAVSYTNYYAYDANGNRTNWVLAGTTYSATYDNQDRLLSWSGGTNRFSPAGFVTNYIVNGSNYVYRYDVKGALRSVTLPDGGPATNIEYVIDPMGRRAGRKVDGTLTNGWIYASGMSPVAETTNGGTTVTKVFVYGRRINTPDYYIDGGSKYRIITDHLGSPRLVARTDNGTILQRVDYDEWGRVLVNTSNNFQPFGFAGGLIDNDSGLVRFGARDYDPETGRWTARDPILFRGGTPNLYAYAFNNPVSYIDPSGKGPSSEDKPMEINLDDLLSGSDDATARILAEQQALIAMQSNMQMMQNTMQSGLSAGMMAGGGGLSQNNNQVNAANGTMGRANQNAISQAPNVSDVFGGIFRGDDNDAQIQQLYEELSDVLDHFEQANPEATSVVPSLSDVFSQI